MKKYFILLSLLAPNLLLAQAEYPGFFKTYFVETVLTIALFVCFIALLVLLVTLDTIKVFLKSQQPEEEKVAEVKAPSAFEKLWTSINDLKPVEQEGDVLTSHEYDGIKELDNNLPPWWKWMFYASIVFAVVYLFHYEVFKTGPTQAEEYNQEIAVAAKEIATYKAKLLASAGPSEAPISGPEAIAAGKGIYMKFCTACHGNLGQGGIGPNFADKYWIHGGSMENIVSIVENGVTNKGMIAWKNQLSGPEIQQVSQFIYSLEGTNPDNQKDPQGEIFERTDGEEEASTGDGE